MIERFTSLFDRAPRRPDQMVAVESLPWEPGSMFVVAHPDDSLLFQSPTLLEHVRSGVATVTVHLTAGDDGRTSKYWRGRELGIMAAYAELAGRESRWCEVSMSVGPDQMILATLDGAPSVRVVFMRLPDGGWPEGTGTRRRRGQSLMNLWLGETATLRSLDGAANYDRATLIEVLATLMRAARVTWVGAMDFLSPFDETDHHDHGACARFTLEAHGRSAPQADLVGFEGYSTSRRAPNVAGSALSEKKVCFYAYGRFDPLVCTSDETCVGTMHEQWLEREYPLETSD